MIKELSNTIRSVRLQRRIDLILANAQDIPLSAKLILTDQLGRYLILKDSKSDWNDLPGGHLHAGESVEQGLRREVFEETGITGFELNPSDACAYHLTLGNKPTAVLVFKAKTPTQNVKLSHEHESYDWVPQNRLCEYNLGVFAETLNCQPVQASAKFHGNQYVRPGGFPSGKIKHAALLMGDKVFRGPSHFHALMEWSRLNPRVKGIPKVDREGFLTESGHFLDREEAADYAIGNKLVRQAELPVVERTGRLESEALVMAKQLVADDQLRKHDTFRSVLEERMRRAVKEVETEPLKKKDKHEELLLLLLLKLRIRDAYLAANPDASDVEAKEYAEERGKLLRGYVGDLMSAKRSGGVLPEDNSLWRRSSGVVAAESQALYGHSILRRLKALGYENKAWISMDDDRVRDTHRECEAQGAIPIDATFSNGLKYPGDPNGGAEEVCNCRCYLIGV